MNKFRDYLYNSIEVVTGLVLITLALTISSILLRVCLEAVL